MYVSDLYNFLAAIKTADDTLASASLLVSIKRETKLTLLGTPAVTPNGHYVYVGNAGENTVVMINSATGDLAGSPIPVGKQPLNLAASPDCLPAFSRFVAVGSVHRESRPLT